MAIIIEEVDVSRRDTYHDRIVALEAGVEYPLGDDHFEICHGENYYAFFDRLGSLNPFIALSGNDVIAMGSGILRSIPRQRNADQEAVWYICDLKVRSDHRKKHLPWRLFAHAFPRKYPKCSRGYGISMNPPGEQVNPVVSIASHFNLISIRTQQLWLYSLNATEMIRAEKTLCDHLGPLSYLSVANTKDIVLKSTGKSWPLLHVQHGPCAQHGARTPIEGHVHMFCLPDNDVIHHSLAESGWMPSATATIISHRMANWDWRFILTSDI